MKAIKIDSENQKLEYVELSSDYHDIYKVLGLGCEMFECPIIFENNDTLYVDEEGLLRGPAKCGFTMELPDGTFWQIIGNGLIIGTDNEGNSVDVVGTIDTYSAYIGWLNIVAAQNYQHQLAY